jgi:hypothetical protein
LKYNSENQAGCLYVRVPFLRAFKGVFAYWGRTSSLELLAGFEPAEQRTDDDAQQQNDEE